MKSGFLSLLIAAESIFVFCAERSMAQNVKNGGDFSTFSQSVPSDAKVPAGVILVKGAWASASDSITPVPEEGNIVSQVFHNAYFGLTYPLPQDWIKNTKVPLHPTAANVLLQLRPGDTFKGPARGSILITAQDLYFSPWPAVNALQLVNYEKNHLQAGYKLELPPTQTRISGRPFLFYAYWSPIAQLHWYVLATEIRCHEVEMVVTSRDPKMLQGLVLDAVRMQVPPETGPTAGTGGGDVPVCIKDYATDEHLITRVDPVFTERTFNPVPVRIIIGKDGKVKHIHFLSAFPSQAKAITDALNSWKFRPYIQSQKPVEVETGIMFGHAPHAATFAVE